jgi:hypothetical protein
MGKLHQVHKCIIILIERIPADALLSQTHIFVSVEYICLYDQIQWQQGFHEVKIFIFPQIFITLCNLIIWVKFWKP